MSSTYEEAAFEVLARFGKPLHYTNISAAAIGLGLLKTDASFPAAGFSTILSSASREADSPFVRPKPGVYGLARRFVLRGIGVASQCACRLPALKEALQAGSCETVVRKSLFVLRNAAEVVRERRRRVVLVIGPRRVEMDLSPSAVRPCQNGTEDCAGIPLSMDEVRAAAALRSRLKLEKVVPIFLLGLAILDVAVEQHAGDSLVLEGEAGTRRISLL